MDLDVTLDGVTMKMPVDAPEQLLIAEGIWQTAEHNLVSPPSIIIYSRTEDRQEEQLVPRLGPI